MCVCVCVCVACLQMVDVPQCLAGEVSTCSAVCCEYLSHGPAETKKREEYDENKEEKEEEKLEEQSEREGKEN